MLSLQEQEVLKIKKRIWKIPTLPKIRMFLWRAVSGALAVADCLNTRGIPVDLMCKLCNAGTESIDHVLFHCDMAKDFWGVAGFKALEVQQNWSTAQNLASLLDLVEAGGLSSELKGAIQWLLWAVWENRNNILYANTSDSVRRQVQQAMEEAKLWTELNRKKDASVSSQSSLVLARRWSPPIQSQVKCNIHANWRNYKLHSGGLGL